MEPSWSRPCVTNCHTAPRLPTPAHPQAVLRGRVRLGGGSGAAVTGRRRRLAAAVGPCQRQPRRGRAGGRPLLPAVSLSVHISMPATALCNYTRMRTRNSKRPTTGCDDYLQLGRRCVGLGWAANTATAGTGVCAAPRLSRQERFHHSQRIVHLLPQESVPRPRELCQPRACSGARSGAAFLTWCASQLGGGVRAGIAAA